MRNKEKNFNCEICDRSCKGLIGLSMHLNTHSISKKEYYDKYFLEDESFKYCNDNGCKEGSKFRGLNGYKKSCGNEKCIRNLYSHSGENHPLWDVGHTEESKERISKNHADVSGENNPMYNESHDKEVRRRISKATKKRLSNPENHPCWKDPEKLKDFKRYCKKVEAETKRWEDEIQKMEVEFCYYCGISLEKYIKENNDKIPEHCSESYLIHIEHKISKRYGYDNGIDPKKIGHIDNLEVCCRPCNSKKHKKTEKEFKKTNE